MKNHQVVVWPENQEAVKVFLELEPDWQTPGEFGGSFRLPSSEVEVGIRLSQAENPYECWRQIQLMKRIAAHYLGKRHRAK